MSAQPAPRTPRNACYHRAPFKASTQLRDPHGTLVAEFPFRMAHDCQYTKTELGQADKLCHGCRWRQGAANDAQSSVIEVVITELDFVRWRNEGHTTDFAKLAVDRMINAGVPAYFIESCAEYPLGEIAVSRGRLVSHLYKVTDGWVFRWTDELKE